MKDEKENDGSETCILRHDETNQKNQEEYYKGEKEVSTLLVEHFYNKSE